MPIKRIPIFGGKNQNADEISLDSLSADLRNGFLTGKLDKYGNFQGSVNKWPGLTEFCNLATAVPVKGIYWWDQIGKFVVVSNGHVFTIDDQWGNSFTDHTGDALTGSNRPTFANHGSLLLIQDGGQMVSFDGTNPTAYVADVDAPTTVKFGAFLDSFALVADEGTGKFYWSDVLDPLNWQGEFADAEGSPDNINALLVGNREIHLIGPESWEVWENSGDADTQFVRKETAFMQRGVAAPYSVIHFDEQVWLALASNREVIALQGRTPVPISSPINKLIQGFGTVADALADQIFVAGRKFYILTFPTEGRTLALDPEFNVWSEISEWSEVTASYDRWRGNCVSYSPSQNLLLVGDSTTGKVYKMDPAVNNNDGDPVRTLIRTGHISWGTHRLKRSLGLSFRVKRTAAGGGGAPELRIRWRDDGDPTWGSEQTITLDSGSYTDFFGTTGPMGNYRTRQYEIFTTADMPIAIESVEEQFEVLKR